MTRLAGGARVTRLARGRVALAAAALIALFAVRGIDTARQKSFSVDEPAYVGTGLYLWKSGDYDMVQSLRFHPPLAYHLASVPLLLFDVSDVELGPEVGRALLAGDPARAEAIRLASRIPFILLACWGAFLAFAWAREVAGDAAGLLALFLYTFSPELLAHGSLAHSDGMVAVLFLQALYAFWRWWRRPTALRLALVGLCVGLACVAKLTAILLVPVVGLGLAAAVIGISLVPGVAAPFSGRGFAARAARAAGAGAVVLGLGAGVLWLAYGGSFALVEGSRFEGVRYPAYFEGLFYVGAANELGRRIYLLGDFLSRGTWYFFPVAFAVKMPVGFLALLAAALVALRERAPLGRFLAVPFAFLLAIAVGWFRVPLGLRYLLPLLPLLCVFVATQLAPALGSAAARPQRVFVAAASAWLAIASLWIHPHYLAYFNELAGGPARGSRYLLDSNLDWGQDLETLARWLEARGNPPVRLAYFGSDRPASYGIRSRPLRGCDPVGGLVAISLNVREGLYAPHNALAAPVPGCFAWLREREPVAVLGYTIAVYDVPRVPARRPGSPGRAGPGASPRRAPRAPRGRRGAGA